MTASHSFEKTLKALASRKSQCQMENGDGKLTTFDSCRHQVNSNGNTSFCLSLSLPVIFVLSLILALSPFSSVSVFYCVKKGAKNKAHETCLTR